MEKQNKKISKVLVLLMAVMMVFTMMPSMAFAAEIGTDTPQLLAETGSADNADDTEGSPQDGKIAITLCGHTAFFSSIELYKWNGSQKEGDNLLSGIERTEHTYSLSLEAGDYFVEGYKDNGDTPEYLGGIVFNVTEDGSHDFKLSAATGIKAGNSGWTLGEDYTMEVKILAQDSSEKMFKMGEITQWGNVVKSCIAFSGDTVTATFTPNAEKRSNFMPATASKTVSNGSSETSISASCQEFVRITFTAPKESKISVGTLKSYYVYNFADADSVTETEAGIAAMYKVAKNTDYFYRVQNPNGVTYWNYARWNKDETVAITEENLYIGSGEFNKKTVFHNFEKNVYDRADIYLNINQAGYMNLSTGDTYELNSFRNWFAIEGISNAKVALPDMYYEVVDFDGHASDVVTIAPDTKNSNVAVMKANKSGTAIVMVTYDAMTHMQGMTAAAATGGEATKQYSAIWPECTGVFVVSVDADGTAVKTNMQLERFGAPSAFDAEHDILFYTGTKGAEFSFTPEEGCTVSVARSTVGNKMSFSGLTTEGITTDENGKVTVSGLTTGRHIIKVEKDGKAAYQVVTARGVSYKVLNADGEELAADAQIKAGDTIKLQFSGLINPQEKLSGVYNFNARCYYQGSDGSFSTSDPGTPWGAYDFSGKAERQLVTVKIPKYWEGTAYTLNGSIKMAGWPGVPTHRMVTYAKGAQRGFDAPAASSILGQLPEISLTLAETEFISAKLNFRDNEGNPVDQSKLTISLTDNDKNMLAVEKDGTFKCYAEDYHYVINAVGYEYTTGTVTVSETDKTFTITLNKTSENAWDGMRRTEPQKDEAGVYRIGTGAELAWFAENSSKNSGIKAKLTADIDLGNYPWKAGNLNSGKCEFDGDGHRVFRLNAVKGLFDTIGGASAVKNVTVEGKITATANAGGIAAYLQSGTIENCVNKAVVNAKGTNNVGGIAGYTYNGAEIKNCTNEGTISCEGKQVGGILGGTVGANATVEGCINKGAVSGTGDVGGIVGKDGNGIAIKNSYNTAAVAGSENVGGVIGSAAGTKISDCYTIGSVTGGKAFAGTASNAVFEKCYYLEGLTTDENAEALSAENLKSADLNEAFKLVCGAQTPKLVWEEGAAHTGEKKTTVAATCTQIGYDVFECSSCKEEYKTNYQAATGHTSDLSKQKDHPAYKDCVCSVCKTEYRSWNDERLQYMVFCSTGLSEVTMSDNGDYPWIWNSKTARFESSNFDKNKTTSETNITFTLTQARYLSFGYGASSEKGYDKVTISLTNNGVETKIADEISGTTSGVYSSKLEAGTYTLKVKYVKDDASKSNEDLGYLTNVKITEKAESEPVTPSTPDAKPSVTFRLIGCEKATQDVDLGTNTYLPNYVTWIATTTYTIEELGENATVGTVFKKALDAKGLAYEGYDGNYISSITAPSGYVLSEMTNGPKSGWMYTVNGSHPNKGLLDWQIKDGDVIIWHYVNDYAYEVQDWVEDAGHPALGNSSTWNGWLKAADTVGGTGGGAVASPVEEKKVTTAVEAGSAVTTAPTEVSVSGSTAKASISNETAGEMVKQAKNNKSSEIVLNVSAAETKNAESIQTEIPKSTLTSIVADTDAQLTITTSQGTLTVDRETMKQMAQEAKGSTVLIEISKVNTPTKAQKDLVGEDAQIYKLTAKTGNTEITQFKGTVTVKLPVLSALEDKKVAAVYLENDGKLTQMPGQKITIEKQEFYVFRTNHFSEYALVDAEKTGLRTEEEMLAQAKEQLAKVNLIARSAKTAKKNVKVSLKMTKASAAAIDEIESLGYTVKYKFYRSTKKAAGYSAKLTKTSKTFTNTKGVKGKKYYYKARVMVYDQDGKLVAYSKLTQCKYAARTWTK